MTVSSGVRERLKQAIVRTATAIDNRWGILMLFLVVGGGFLVYSVGEVPLSKHLEKANRALDSNQYEKALSYINQAERYYPASSELLILKGETLRFLERYDEALGLYEKLVAADSTNWRSLQGRADCYRFFGLFEKAIQDFTLALKQLPQNFLSYIDESAMLLGRATSYENLEMYEEALKDFDEAVRVNWNNPTIFKSRGLFHLKRGNFEKAINDAASAIRYQPKDSTAYQLRGMAYDASGNFAKSVQDLKYSLKLSPNNPQSLYRLGQVYAKQKELGLAKSSFDAAIRYDKKFQRAYEERALVHRELGDEQNAQRDEKMASELFSSPTQP